MAEKCAGLFIVPVESPVVNLVCERTSAVPKRSDENENEPAIQFSCLSCYLPTSQPTPAQAQLKSPVQSCQDPHDSSALMEELRLISRKITWLGRGVIAPRPIREVSCSSWEGVKVRYSRWSAWGRCPTGSSPSR